MIFLSVSVSKFLRVKSAECSKVVDLGERKFHVTLNYGYLELPDIPRDIRDLKFGTLELDSFVGTVLVSGLDLDRP